MPELMNTSSGAKRRNFTTRHDVVKHYFYIAERLTIKTGSGSARFLDHLGDTPRLGLGDRSAFLDLHQVAGLGRADVARMDGEFALDSLVGRGHAAEAVLAFFEQPDDALGAAAVVAAADPTVERVVICTPDKDLAQCVGGKVVQFDRRAGQFRDVAAVTEKYGVPPESIPDWLALVGDSADGFPGLPGWGAKTAATVLRRYVHLEEIPHAPGQWDALLFKRLATLDTSVDVGTPQSWHWAGPTDSLEQWCERLDAPDVLAKARRLAGRADAG